MSRGHGRLQRFWIKVAAHGEGEIWTFDDLCRSAFPEAYEPGMEMKPSFKRSLRRALKGMVEDGNIIPLGAGGRTDPFRYCINPSLLRADNPRRDSVMKHLQPHGFYWSPEGVLSVRCGSPADAYRCRIAS
jgi:hypothetical protein